MHSSHLGSSATLTLVRARVRVRIRVRIRIRVRVRDFYKGKTAGQIKCNLAYSTFAAVGHTSSTAVCRFYELHRGGNPLATLAHHVVWAPHGMLAGAADFGIRKLPDLISYVSFELVCAVQHRIGNVSGMGTCLPI